MDTHCMSQHFVGLAVIVNDYDAILRRSSEEQDKKDADKYDVVSPSSTTSDHTWKMGFNDFADDLWSRMTLGMKRKLRIACVEVLHKTDEPEPAQSHWQAHDDADMLD